MTKALQLTGGVEVGVRTLLRFLLESGRVSAVATLMRAHGHGVPTYALITDPELLADAVPFFPLMPVNAGKELSRLTLKGLSPRPIAVLMRPCEVRALVELLKRSQGGIENLVIISTTCAGVYPLSAAQEGDMGEKLSEYWEAAGRGDQVPAIRENCQACVDFVPSNVDMTVTLVGSKGSEEGHSVLLHTERAVEAVTGIDCAIIDRNPGAWALEGYLEQRRSNRGKVLAAVENIELREFFARCIGCRGCSKVCPVCYCQACYFESAEFEDRSRALTASVGPDSNLQVDLEGILFYQLVRLFHVGLSCVACGQCSDACPVGIPVGLIAMKTSGAVQQAFDYVSGRSISEALPMTTFIPEEFERYPVEQQPLRAELPDLGGIT